MSDMQQISPSLSSSSVSTHQAPMDVDFTLLMNNVSKSIQIHQQINEILSVPFEEYLTFRPVKASQHSSTKQFVDRFHKQAYCDKNNTDPKSQVYTFCLFYNKETRSFNLWLSPASMCLEIGFASFWKAVYNLIKMELHSEYITFPPVVYYYYPSLFNSEDVKVGASKSDTHHISSIRELVKCKQILFVTAHSTATLQHKVYLSECFGSERTDDQNLTKMWSELVQGYTTSRQNSLRMVKPGGDRINLESNELVRSYALTELKNLHMEIDNTETMIQQIDTNSNDVRSKIKTEFFNLKDKMTQNLEIIAKSYSSPVEDTDKSVVLDHYTQILSCLEKDRPANQSYMSACAHYLNHSIFGLSSEVEVNSLHLLGINLPSVFCVASGSLDEGKPDFSADLPHFNAERVKFVIRYLLDHPSLFCLLLSKPSVIILIPFFVEKSSIYDEHWILFIYDVAFNKLVYCDPLFSHEEGKVQNPLEQLYQDKSSSYQKVFMLFQHLYIIHYLYHKLKLEKPLSFDHLLMSLGVGYQWIFDLVYDSSSKPNSSNIHGFNNRIIKYEKESWKSGHIVSLTVWFIMYMMIKHNPINSYSHFCILLNEIKPFDRSYLDINNFNHEFRQWIKKFQSNQEYEKFVKEECYVKQNQFLSALAGTKKIQGFLDELNMINPDEEN